MARIKNKLGYCFCGEPLDYYGVAGEKGTRIDGKCPRCNTKVEGLSCGWMWGVILNELTRVERLLLRGRHG